MGENEELHGAVGMALGIDGIPSFTLTGDPNELSQKWRKMEEKFRAVSSCKSGQRRGPESHAVAALWRYGTSRTVLHSMRQWKDISGDTANP